MQPGVFLHAIRLNQLDKPGKCGLGMHHLEDGIVLAVATIVQQECCYYVERGVVFLLWLNQPRPVFVVSMLRTCRRQYIICRRT
jgi:hypothetical protein